MLPRERIFVVQGVSRRKAAKSCLRARPKCTQKAYGRGAALSGASRGGCKDWSEREVERVEEEGEERCKERDNNKWLARRRMLDLHEKIDGLEKGDACSVCSWPVRAANPPILPLNYLFSQAENKYLPLLAVFIVDAFRRKYLAGWQCSIVFQTYSARAQRENCILEEGCFGKVVCWNNERNNAVTSSAITAATNWIRLQWNCEGLRLARRQKLFHTAAAISQNFLAYAVRSWKKTLPPTRR